jgi:hypothetical protein
LLVDISLLYEGKQVKEQSAWFLVLARKTADNGRQLFEIVVADVQRNGELFEVVGRLRTCCGLTNLLNGRDQQPKQERQYSQDDQQFDHGEAESDLMGFGSHGSLLPQLRLAAVRLRKMEVADKPTTMHHGFF